MSKEHFRFEYDPVVALKNCPKLLGMELTQHGRKLEGGYYLNGDRHQWRKDKLKIFISQGTVWLSEEGGPSMSLQTWLVNYGGAADYKEAISMINGQKQSITYDREVRQKAEVAVKYVPWEAVRGAANYDLRKCSLFNWMCTLFPEEKVREVWKKYNVTTDSHSNCVYWVVDKDNHVLFDKRILYKEDGHRDRTFFPGRQYRVADGYSGRCYFGEHVVDPAKKVYVVESEKSVLLIDLTYGRQAVATGGKNNLRDLKPNMVLLPDYDSARDEWEAKAKEAGVEVWPWWEKWGLPIEQIPDHSDIGDMIVWKQSNHKVI